jgi:hypothetical protein
MSKKILPAKLKKILQDLPPCQVKQIKRWVHENSGSPPFIFCDGFPCEICIQYKATMITICPRCETSVATTIVIPKNGKALCRNVNCVCGREYRIVFNKEFCDICERKVECLSIPITIPELCLHEKIK